MAVNEVLVGTPEVFRKSLADRRLLGVNDLSLVVFDECHNAVGNSPMRAMMDDCLSPHRCETPRCPRNATDDIPKHINC